MKKKSTFLTVLLFLAIAVKSQIPNYGFEQLNSDGSLRNWGNVYLMPMWIDTNGTSYVDSIVFDNYFYAPTSDAHFGNRALELRNAWDYTTGQGIAGGATADADTMYSAWGSFETFEILNQPFNFAFFYKFFPAGNDTAVASLQLFDSSMNTLGGAEILIGGTVSNYALATVPVVWTTPGFAAFAYIHFRTATYGSIPTLGTRMLIDDVMFNYVTGVNEVEENDGMNLFPNPASDRIQIQLENQTGTFNVEIINAFGQLVSSTKSYDLDVSGLPAGMYVVRVITQDKIFLKRFIKE